MRLAAFVGSDRHPWFQQPSSGGVYVPAARSTFPPGLAYSPAPPPPAFSPRYVPPSVPGAMGRIARLPHFGVYDDFYADELDALSEFDGVWDSLTSGFKKVAKLAVDAATGRPILKYAIPGVKLLAPGISKVGRFVVQSPILKRAIEGAALSLAGPAGPRLLEIAASLVEQSEKHKLLRGAGPKILDVARSALSLDKRTPAPTELSPFRPVTPPTAAAGVSPLPAMKVTEKLFRDVMQRAAMLDPVRVTIVQRLVRSGIPAPWAVLAVSDALGQDAGPPSSSAVEQMARVGRLALDEFGGLGQTGSVDVVAKIGEAKAEQARLFGYYTDEPGADSVPRTGVYVAHALYQGLVELGKLEDAIAKHRSDIYASWKRDVVRFGDAMTSVFAPYDGTQVPLVDDLPQLAAATFWDAAQRFAIAMQGYIDRVSPGDADLRYQAWKKMTLNLPSIYADAAKRALKAGARAVGEGIKEGAQIAGEAGRSFLAGLGVPIVLAAVGGIALVAVLAGRRRRGE